MSPVPVYDGPFYPYHAHRLLYRAGFGPLPGQADRLSDLGLERAVDSLIHPPSSNLIGPAPAGTFLVDGQLAPATKWGHIHLAFLDRAVRSADPLGERMALILHDWFGVSFAEADYRWVDGHLALLRKVWRGSFRDTLREVTRDPGMLQFLGGTANNKVEPNENYGRELMELFSLGADRGAYNETDVREMARVLTGWRMDWNNTDRGHNFRFDPQFHDEGEKRLFAGKSWEKRGNLTWSDAADAVVDHPYHPSFLIPKLWSYFIPTEPSDETQLGLEAIYRGNGEQLLPVVEAILKHPDLYEGPSMLKNPVVYTAGLLRARNRSITSDAWVWMDDFAGMLIGSPPNVSGWNDRAWLNTSTFSARWGIAKEVLETELASASTYDGRLDEEPYEAHLEALRFWDLPPFTLDTRKGLAEISQQTRLGGVTVDTASPQAFLAARQNTLRQFVVVAPDFHVS